MGIKGFTTQFAENPYMIEKQGDVIVMKGPLSNVDNCYNTTTGAFTAHKTGVYSFQMSGMVATGDLSGRSELILEKLNGHPLQKIFLRSRGDIFVGSQGSFDVKVKLEKGEGVQVRHVRDDLGLMGQSETTLSGLLEFEYPDTATQYKASPLCEAGRKDPDKCPVKKYMM